MAKFDKNQIKTPDVKIAVPQYSSAAITKKAVLYATFAFILSFLIFGNTIQHEYALDDLVSITQNSNTLNGIDGIGRLLTKDSFDGYTTYVNLVSGGRYRPLALITFAIEIQIFGKNIPHVSHFGNVLLFALSMSLLFLVCYRFLFKGKYLASAIACVLFIIHPLHTEVVANIKSRDEILMFLFSLGTMYFLFEYLGNKKKWILLALSGISFFLALMSKENAVMFIVFIPLVLYYFYGANLKTALKESWVLFIVLFVFLIIRFSITGLHSNPQNEILNAPYLWANPLEAFATKVYILMRYLILMVVPYPLSCLYTWNAIPYISTSDWRFLLSFVLHIGIIFIGIKGFFSKKPLSFFILNYLAMILLVSNFIFDIGALMGDRFMYQAGFPLILAVGFYVDMLFNKTSKTYFKVGIIIGLFAILSIYSVLTIKRNAAWTNDDTIAVEDRDTYECAHIKINAASAFLRLSLKENDPKKKDSLFTLSRIYFHKGLAIYPTYVDGHIIAGSCFYLKGNIDSAIVYYDKAFNLSPENLTLKGYFPIIAKDFYDRAQKEIAKNEIEKAAQSFRIAMKHDPLYLQLIGFFYDKAVELYLNKKYDKALEFLDYYLEFKKDDLKVLLLYGDMCYYTQKLEKAREMYTKALAIDPQNALVIKQLQNIQSIISK